MKRIKSSWAPALLLICTVVAEAGLDLHKSDAGPRIDGQRIEDLISEVDKVQVDNVGTLDIPTITQINKPDIGDIADNIAQNGGLDLSSLVEGIAQGQGNGQGHSESTGSVGAGDFKDIDVGALANQKAEEISSNIDQILNGLNGHGQSLKNSSTAQGQGRFNLSDIADNIANQLAPNRQGHGKGQNGVIIQVDETIILEAGGQQIQTELIQVGGQHTQVTTTNHAQGMNATLSSENTKTAEAVSASEAATVTVSAGGEQPGGTHAAAATTSASVVAINSATLTPGGLAANTTSAVASAVTVQAGGSGHGNSSSTLTSASASVLANDTVATTVTVLAESGSSGLSHALTSASVSAATAGSASSEAVTVVAGSEAGSSSSIAQGTATGSAVTVLAGSGTASAHIAATSSSSSSITASAGTAGTGTLTNNALTSTTTTSNAAAAVTVVAGSESNNTNAAVQAAQNGGCNCQCICPAESFPMVAPQAPAFQLGSMGLPGTTMQTVASAVTVIAGGEAPPGAEQAATSSTSGVSIDSATLTPSGLLAASTTTAAGQAVSMIASGSTSISPEAPEATSTSAAAATSVDVQSQVADGAPTPAPPQNQGQNGLPFDINTVDLQSRVTVKLGRRSARPTGLKRGW